MTNYSMHPTVKEFDIQIQVLHIQIRWTFWTGTDRNFIHETS